VMKKHQPAVKKKSNRTKAQRRHRRQQNQELTQRVAERIRDATERSHAAAGTRTRPTTAPTTKVTAGCRSSRELAAAALATVLQGLHPRKLTSAAGVLSVATS
jgi:hypothetical protein